MTFIVCAVTEHEALVASDGRLVAWDASGLRPISDGYRKFEIVSPGVAIAVSGPVDIASRVFELAERTARRGRRTVMDDVVRSLAAQLPAWHRRYCESAGPHQAAGAGVIVVGFDQVAGRCRLVLFTPDANYTPREPVYAHPSLCGRPVWQHLGSNAKDLVSTMAVPALSRVADWAEWPAALLALKEQASQKYSDTIGGQAFGVRLGRGYTVDLEDGCAVAFPPDDPRAALACQAPDETQESHPVSAGTLPVALNFSAAVTVAPYSNEPIQKTSKTIRIPGVAFQPATSSTPWYVDPSGAVGANGAVLVNGYAPIPIPTGTTVTAYRMRSKIALTGTVTVTLVKCTDTTTSGIGIGATTSAATGTAFATTEAGAFSGEALTGSAYILGVSIDATGAGAATDVLLAWVDVDYTSPALDVSL